MKHENWNFMLWIFVIFSLTLNKQLSLPCKSIGRFGIPSHLATGVNGYPAMGGYLLLLLFWWMKKAKCMLQQSNHYTGHSSCSCPQTLLNSANFQNGTVLQSQHLLAALSALVKRCPMDQAVPGLSISVLCPSCYSLSQAVLTGAMLGYRFTAKTFPTVLMLCQCYYLCANGSIIVIMVDVKNVFCVLCVFRSICIW